MLAAAGKLDLSRPAGSPAMNLKVIELANNGPQAQRLAASGRRQPASQRLLAAVARADAQLAGGLRFRRAGDGHRRPRHDDRRAAGPVPAQRSVRADRVAGAWPTRVARGQRDSDDAERIDRAYRLDVRPRGHARTEIARADDYLAAYAVAVNDAQAAPPTANSRRQNATPQGGSRRTTGRSRCQTGDSQSRVEPCSFEQVDRRAASAVGVEQSHVEVGSDQRRVRRSTHGDVAEFLSGFVERGRVSLSVEAFTMLRLDPQKIRAMPVRRLPWHACESCFSRRQALESASAGFGYRRARRAARPNAPREAAASTAHPSASACSPPSRRTSA